MWKGSPKYDQNFHPNDLLERMRQGQLDIEVYAAWGISKKSFYKWLQDHEDLKDAHETGLPACEAWWLQEMKKKWQKGDEKGFKYCALIVNTKFGYRENQSPTAITNNTINVHGNMNVLQEKSRDELIEFINNNIEDAEYVRIESDETQSRKEK